MSLMQFFLQSETFFISLSAKRPELGIHFTISEKMFLVILSIFFVNLEDVTFLRHFVASNILGKNVRTSCCFPAMVCAL